MSLRSVIGVFATGNYQVTRRAAGTMLFGRYLPGSAITIDISASVQPVTGRQLRTLPEGQSASETRVIYTTTELKTRTPTTEPDRIRINGEAWDVINVEVWDGNSGSPHYVAMAARQAIP